MGVVWDRILAGGGPLLRPLRAAESKEIKMSILNYKIMFRIKKIVELLSQRKGNSNSNFGLLEIHNFC